MVRLKIRIPQKNGSLRTKDMELDCNSCVAGRNQNGLRITDPRCSRKHFLLFKNFKGVLHLVDLNSTNGTYVNGKRVEETSLEIGDKIRIGHTLLVVEKFQPERESPPSNGTSRQNSGDLVPL